MNLFHGYLVSLLFILDLFFFSYRITDVLIDNFDIVNFDKSADRFDIYLDEKKVFLK